MSYITVHDDPFSMNAKTEAAHHKSTAKMLATQPPLHCDTAPKPMKMKSCTRSKCRLFDCLDVCLFVCLFVCCLFVCCLFVSLLPKTEGSRKGRRRESSALLPRECSLHHSLASGRAVDSPPEARGCTRGRPVRRQCTAFMLSIKGE